MVLHPSLFNNCLLIPHSTGEGCIKSDVEVTIIPPSIEEMFSKQKGTVICQVKVNKPSVDKIAWEDQDGNQMGNAEVSPAKGTKGIISLPLEMTFDEWNKGEKRICTVDHDDWFEQLKKPYERNVGKKTIQQLCTKTLC